MPFFLLLLAEIRVIRMITNHAFVFNLRIGEMLRRLASFQDAMLWGVSDTGGGAMLNHRLHDVIPPG